MDKILRAIKIMLLVVLIVTAFIAGVGAGTASGSGAREADQAGAREIENLDGCRVYVWEHGKDAGKVVITTRLENISELQGGILVIREKGAVANE